MKKYQRLFVCLSLVACLLMGVSPVHAFALSDSEYSTVFVDADIAVASALIALGIAPGSTDTDFDSFVTTVISAPEFAAFIQDKKMELIHYGDSYGIRLEFLDALKNWLYDYQVVTCNYQPGFGSRISANTLVTIRDDGTAIYGTHDFIFCPITTASYPSIDNCVGYAVSTSPDFMGYNHKNVQVCPQRTPFTYKDTQYYYITWNKNNDLVNPYDAYADGVELMDALYMAIDGTIDLSTTACNTSYNLTLAVVGRDDLSVSDVHSEWAAGAVTVDSSGAVYLPVGLAADYDAVKVLSQDQIQSGDSSYGDTGTTEPTTPGDSGSDAGSNRYVDALSSGSLQGLLDEIIDILPVIIPVSLAVFGITKGVSWLISVIKGS